MRTLIVISIIFFSSVCLYSQKNDTIYATFKQQNTVGVDISYFNIAYFDALSTILNYERSLKSNLNLRIGLGYFSIPANAGFSGLQFPISLSLISGKKNNHFEFDFGGRISFTKNALNSYSFPNEYIISAIYNLGYRYQKPTGGLIYKALVGIDGLTLGIGYTF